MKLVAHACKLAMLLSVCCFALDCYAFREIQPTIQLSKKLVQNSDSIVWVEFLAYERISKPEYGFQPAESLEELIALVKNDLDNTTHIFTFNLLSEIYGNVPSLTFRTIGYTPFAPFGSKKLMVSERYLLFSNEGNILGLVKVNGSVEMELMTIQIGEYMHNDDFEIE